MCKLPKFISFCVVVFRTTGTQGSITMNGHERNLSQFRKLSCYIMQDNQLHANLSVEEAMNVATALKLGKDVSRASRQNVVCILLCSFLSNGMKDIPAKDPQGSKYPGFCS